nr:nucleotide-binding alpha-beta plait domain-containing protein [Tanacetum cinerariifolium]
MVMSGSLRSKEDDVQKISTSVFVTNFPDGYGAKDLWNTCKLYGMSWMFLFLIKERKQNDVHSEDPFGFYEVLNKKRDGKNIDDKHKDSLKYPPGFTPNEEGDVPVEMFDNWSDTNRVNDGQKDGVCVGQHVHERVEVSNDTHESTCSGHFKKSEVPRKGCIKNMEEIIESQGVDEIHR